MDGQQESLSHNTLIIINPWKKSVESYFKAGENIKVKRPDRCPVCGCVHLIFWGKRRRYAIDGKCEFKLFVRRVRCKRCLRVHTILPAFLLYRRVYPAKIIIAALNLTFLNKHGTRGMAAALAVARSTGARWIKSFRAVAKSHYRRFLYLYHTHFPQAPPIKPTGSYCSAALHLAKRLFVFQSRGAEIEPDLFASRLSLATSGYLLDRANH